MAAPERRSEEALARPGARADVPDAEAWVTSWFESKGPIPGAARAERLATNYFEAGLIDSLGVVGLVADIEKAFSIRFEDRHYQEPRFATIGGLAELIRSLAEAKA